MPLVKFNRSPLSRSFITLPVFRKATRRAIVTALLLILALIPGLFLASSANLHAFTLFQSDKITVGPGEYESFSPAGDIRRFAGESLKIDISFLSLFNAATAKVSFYEKDGTFYSILESETKGFVGFFTSYRKHRYKSTFDIVDNGRRLRTKKFEQEIITGNTIEKTTHIIDYNAGVTWWFEYKNGEMTKENRRKLPKDFYFDDILATFYNFRNSVYGKIEKQTNYTIPDSGLEKIAIYINSEEEAEQYGKVNGRRNGDDMLLKAVIPKEIFKTENGELWFWVSKHLIPLETTVKDYILLGDLRAVLVKREFTAPK